MRRMDLGIGLKGRDDEVDDIDLILSRVAGVSGVSIYYYIRSLQNEKRVDIITASAGIYL